MRAFIQMLASGDEIFPHLGVTAQLLEHEGPVPSEVQFEPVRQQVVVLEVGGGWVSGWAGW